MKLREIKNFTVLLFAFAMLYPVSVVYASGGHAQPTIENLLWPFVNASIYLAILIWVYKKYLSQEIVKKADKLQGFLDASKKRIVAAEESLQEVVMRHDRLEDEKVRIISEYQSEGEKIGLQLIQNAHLQVKSIEETIERQINSELNQAHNEVKSEIMIEAIRQAKQLIKSELSVERDKKIRFQALDYLN